MAAELAGHDASDVVRSRDAALVALLRLRAGQDGPP